MKLYAVTIETLEDSYSGTLTEHILADDILHAIQAMLQAHSHIDLYSVLSAELIAGIVWRAPRREEEGDGPCQSAPS